MAAPTLRVEGRLDDSWVVWDKKSYLRRVVAFRERIGEQAEVQVRAIREDRGRAIVETTLYWGQGGVADTLVFSHEPDGWFLRHKTFRFLEKRADKLVLYTAEGPNGYKVAIALEELGTPYEVRVVDLSAGEHHQPPIRALNPNAKVPILVDPVEEQVVFESNAILLYLADRAERLAPPPGPARYDALKWLFFQAASLGPMLGQRGHFEAFAPEPMAYAIHRYRHETERLYDVLETELELKAFLLGEYSIVDMSCFSWLYCARAFGFRFEKDRPKLTEWFHRIHERQAVQQGLRVPTPFSKPQPTD